MVFRKAQFSKTLNRGGRADVRLVADYGALNLDSAGRGGIAPVLLHFGQHATLPSASIRIGVVLNEVVEARQTRGDADSQRVRVSCQHSNRGTQ